MLPSRSFAWVLFITSASSGQAPPPSPAFEAASVKPSKPGDLGGSTFQFTTGGGLKIINGTLRGIIESAYSMRDFQILDGPGWLNSERYDILAKAANGGSIAETRLRLQALLGERFQLRVHRETRNLPEYALVVGRNGFKLVRNEGSLVPAAGIRSGCGQMTGTMTTIANLAVYLERQLTRPVLDETGLSGRYDFQLNWAPDADSCRSPNDTGDHGTAADGPSLFTALQEKLGLKLESKKGPVEVLVVDHAEKVDEN
jgi:uncharacterized protein (TIGR03435 family)